jgi:hypothetical protein
MNTLKNVRIVALCLTLALMGGLAAAAEGYEAPEVKDDMPWLGIALAGLSLVGVLFGVFHNQKRSHLEDN